MAECLLRGVTSERGKYGASVSSSIGKEIKKARSTSRGHRNSNLKFQALQRSLRSGGRDWKSGELGGLKPAGAGAVGRRLGACGIDGDSAPLAVLKFMHVCRWEENFLDRRFIIGSG